MKVAYPTLLIWLGSIMLLAATPSTDVSSPSPNPKPSPVQTGIPLRPNGPPLNPNAVTAQEWQELLAARTAALQANPDLMSNANEISQKMRDFQQRLNAAVIKTNPSLAPFIAMMEHGGLRPPLPPQAPLAGAPTAVTPAPPKP